ncbi:HAD-IA family hydrolase [Roseivivax isoporae]|uniref:HAD family hydrolase n=1 Tax=Roseivivax isoporae LMG 25204 TaxID=1449351 RepID=X7F5H1_9RHOB|nr:HAD-IA family hydrolase [Roseivivax isoporae]ETX27973.1 HAD family hydrolase [Roseivivax isoporae LMG 25204]
MTDLRLVIFDVDGTLVDSQADILAAMGVAFDAAGLVAPGRAEVLGIVGLSLPEAFARLVPAADAETRAHMTAAYKGAYADLRQRQSVDASSPLYPGVRSVLDALDAQPGMLLGIATGKSRRGLRAVLEGHGLAGRFVTTQTADDHPSKPHPAMIAAALAETGCDPRAAVMVGDTEYDMAMARAAGVTAIGVGWGYHDRARLGAAHHLIAGIDELPPLLDLVWEDA